MNPNFEKCGGLIPAVVQDFTSATVLMVGYMNEEAFFRTREKGLVTFYSRSKERLWTKGEDSGNYLKVVSLSLDCDKDAVLVVVEPTGNVCHTGSFSCFNQDAQPILAKLEQVISDRIEFGGKNSYVKSLCELGESRLAQKVGEEAVEVVIATMKKDGTLADEAADLLFHLLVLLKSCKMGLANVLKVLHDRAEQ